MVAYVLIVWKENEGEGKSDALVGTGDRSEQGNEKEGTEGREEKEEQVVPGEREMQDQRGIPEIVSDGEGQEGETTQEGVEGRPQLEVELISEIDRILQEKPVTVRKKRKRKKGRWGTRRRQVMGERGGEQRVQEEEKREKPVKSPKELMEKLIEKDPNLNYKFEQSGREINYLDLNMKIEEGEVRIDIFHKDTHTWDIPEWKGRVTIQH